LTIGQVERYAVYLYVVHNICCMFSFAQYFLNISDVNAVPRSVIICRGLPNRADCFVNLLIVSSDVVDLVEYNYVNLENKSITTNK